MPFFLINNHHLVLEINPEGLTGIFSCCHVVSYNEAEAPSLCKSTPGDVFHSTAHCHLPLLHMKVTEGNLRKLASPGGHLVGRSTCGLGASRYFSETLHATKGRGTLAFLAILFFVLI